MYNILRKSGLYYEFQKYFGAESVSKASFDGTVKAIFGNFKYE